MLVCMLLVVGRIARHAVAARTGVEEERRLGCLAPGVFVLRFGRALLLHNNYIVSCHLCVFLCASEYTEIETHSPYSGSGDTDSRHAMYVYVKQLVCSPPSQSPVLCRVRCGSLVLLDVNMLLASAHAA